MIQRIMPKTEDKNFIYTYELKHNDICVCVVNERGYLLGRYNTVEDSDCNNYKWISLDNAICIFENNFNTVKDAVNHMLNQNIPVYRVKDFNEAMEFFQGKKEIPFICE